eukprot:289463_1
MAVLTLITVAYMMMVLCTSDLCIQSSSSSAYFISGSYIYSHITADGQTVLTLTHPCGNRLMYYNTILKRLVIAESVPTITATDYSYTYNAICNDEEVTEATQCSNWNVGSYTTDLTVTSGGCTPLCGANGRCTPQHQISLNINSNTNCNGVFSKMDYMDIYESSDGYYWFEKGGNWMCTASLPICDGTSYLVYELLQDEHMKQSMECTTP